MANEEEALMDVAEIGENEIAGTPSRKRKQDFEIWDWKVKDLYVSPVARHRIVSVSRSAAFITL